MGEYKQKMRLIKKKRVLDWLYQIFKILIFPSIQFYDLCLNSTNQHFLSFFSIFRSSLKGLHPKVRHLPQLFCPIPPNQLPHSPPSFDSFIHNFVNRLPFTSLHPATVVDYKGRGIFFLSLNSSFSHSSTQIRFNAFSFSLIRPKQRTSFLLDLKGNNPFYKKESKIHRNSILKIIILNIVWTILIL